MFLIILLGQEVNHAYGPLRLSWVNWDVYNLRVRGSRGYYEIVKEEHLIWSV